jgi:hypothetical protein
VTAKAARPVTIRRGNGTVTLDLLPTDFIALRQINERDVEIRALEKSFRRLQKFGLATHRFVKVDGDDWPKAFAKLTQEGEQALAQEFAR